MFEINLKFIYLTYFTIIISTEITLKSGDKFFSKNSQ